MGNSYIYNKVEKLVKKFKTRDPFEILEEMNVIVGETDRYEKLKGYCFMSCQTIYVMVSSFLSEEEKKIVAAHELGHIILHRSQLKMAPMKDDVLYNMRDNTEWHVHCSVCGAFIEKSAHCDSEVECKKCRSTLEILVKDDIVSVRPLHIKDEKLKERMRVYSQKVMNSRKETK